MKDLDMIGDATRVRCEKYSSERVVVPDPQWFRHYQSVSVRRLTKVNPNVHSLSASHQQKDIWR